MGYDKSPSICTSLVDSVACGCRRHSMPRSNKKEDWVNSIEQIWLYKECISISNAIHTDAIHKYFGEAVPLGSLVWLVQADTAARANKRQKKTNWLLRQRTKLACNNDYESNKWMI